MSEVSKSVLITGTSVGVGYATSLIMAEAGWTVFAGVRKEADFKKLQEAHTNIRPVYLDVTKSDQISAAVETIRVAVGEAGLDALVNNAAAMNLVPFEFISPAAFEAEIRLNLFGVVELSRAALPLLRVGKPGRIINISSFLGVGTMPYCSAYCASKHALEALTKCMRQELKPMGISLSILGPGPIKTNFSNVAFKSFEDSRADNADNDHYKKYYAETIAKAKRLSESSQKSMGLEPKAVGEVIKHMLTTTWLRHRYCDCYATWFTTLLNNWLPSWASERLVATLISNA